MRSIDEINSYIKGCQNTLNNPNTNEELAELLRHEIAILRWVLEEPKQ